MSSSATRHADTAPSGRLRIPRWLTLASSALGSIIGVATNLYSSEFRAALGNLSELNPTLVSGVVTAVVAGGTTAAFYRWSIKRRQQMTVTDETIAIQPGVKDFTDRPIDEKVTGRDLHYLEAKRDSSDLIVFLHGLGLDAFDFRPYMVESRYHCVALTFFGFNDTEKDDNHYGVISLDSHMALLAYALDRLHQLYPKKRMTIVGFSFGADMILFLDEYTRRSEKRVLANISIHKALLLDPNIDRRTTTISSRIARIDQANPEVAELLELLGSASQREELRYLCEYLYKILDKNFAQVQRHATEVVQKWDVDSPTRFLDYLGRLIKATGGVHVILSYNYENLFTQVTQGADDRGLDVDSLECCQNDHFELISAAFLKERLEGLL